MERLPRLRSDIQLLPAEVQGQRVLAVKDMLELNAQMVALRPQVAAFLPLFDGSHTIRDLQEAMMRSRGNQLVMRAEAEQLVRDLDNMLVLQSDSYRLRKERIRLEFAARSVRPAALAGSAYPEETDNALGFVRSILAEGGATEPLPAVRALVAPHIDLRVGRVIYGKAYSRLPDCDYHRIVLIGTGHSLEDGLFCLTDKRYETPLGSFPPDREALEHLRQAGPECLAPDDFAHRTEHSLEFQVLFLRALLKEDTPLIPLLAGSPGEHLLSRRRPADMPGAGNFLAALRELCGPGTLVVAGVDLCHVGPKFGHPAPAAAYQHQFEHHDRRILAALCRGSAEELWAESARVEDRFHVCGLLSLATMLEVLPGASGQVLGYEVWHEPSTRSAVSFAAAALS